MPSKSRFKNTNLNAKLGSQRPSETKKPSGNRSAFAVIQGGDSRKVARPVGAAAAPMPVNTSSLKRENNGMDTSIALVPGGKGARWGLETSSATDTQITNVASPSLSQSHAHTHTLATVTAQFTQDKVQSQAKVSSVPSETSVSDANIMSLTQPMHSRARAWADMSDDDDDDRGGSLATFNVGGVLDSLGGDFHSHGNAKMQEQSHSAHSGLAATFGRGLMGDARASQLPTNSHHVTQHQYRDRSDSGSWRDAMGAGSINTSTTNSPAFGAFGDRFNRSIGNSLSGYDNPKGNFGGDARGVGRDRSGSYGNDFRNTGQSLGTGNTSAYGLGSRAPGNELRSGGGVLGLGGGYGNGSAPSTATFGNPSSGIAMPATETSETGQIERTRLEMERVKIAKQQKMQREAEERLRQEQQEEQRRVRLEREQQEQREREARMRQVQQQQRILNRSDDFDPRAARGESVSGASSQWGRAQGDNTKRISAPVPAAAPVAAPVRHVPVPSSSLVPAWGGAGVAALGGVKTLAEIQAAEELAALREAAEEAKKKALAVARSTQLSRNKEVDTNAVGNTPVKQGPSASVSNPMGRQLFDPKSKTMITPTDTSGLLTSPAGKSSAVNPAPGAGRKVSVPASTKAPAPTAASAPAPALLQRPERKKKEAPPAPTPKDASQHTTQKTATVVESAPLPKPITPITASVIAPPKPPMPEVSSEPTVTKIIRASAIVGRTASSSSTSNDAVYNNSNDISKGSAGSNSAATILSSSNIHINHTSLPSNNAKNAIEDKSEVVKKNPLEGWVPRDNRDITRQIYEARDNRELAREISLASGRGIPAPLRDIVTDIPAQSRKPLGGFGFGSGAGAKDSAAAEAQRKEREREQLALSRGVGPHAGRDKETRERDLAIKTNTSLVHTNERSGARSSNTNDKSQPVPVVKGKSGDANPSSKASVKTEKAKAAGNPTEPVSIASDKARAEDSQAKDKARNDKGAAKSAKSVDKDKTAGKGADVRVPKESFTPNAVKSSTTDIPAEMSRQRTILPEASPIIVPAGSKAKDSTSRKEGVDLATDDNKQKKPRLTDEEFAAQKAAKKALLKAKKAGCIVSTETSHAVSQNVSADLDTATEKKKAESATHRRAAKASVEDRTTSGIGTFTLSMQSTSIEARTRDAVDSDDEAVETDRTKEPIPASGGRMTREQKQAAKKEQLTKLKAERRERGKRNALQSEEKPVAPADLSDLGASIDRLDFAGLSQLASPIKTTQPSQNTPGGNVGDIDHDLYGAASCLDDDMSSHVVVGSVLGGILDDLEGPADSTFGRHPIDSVSANNAQKNGMGRNNERRPREGRGPKPGRGGRGKGRGDSNPSGSGNTAPEHESSNITTPDLSQSATNGAKNSRSKGGRGSGGRGGRGEAGKSDGGQGRGASNPRRGPPAQPI